MINVLFITDCLKQRFGVTAVILNYLENIPKDEIRIDLLIYEDSEKDIIEHVKELGSDVFFMPNLGVKSIILFRDYIKSFFVEHSYDIVHSHFNQIDSIVFPIARRNGVKCCISHSHNTRLSDTRIKQIRNRLMCWNIRWNADVLAACSEKAGMALYGEGFKNSKKKLIVHNGINIERFTFNPGFRKLIRDEFNILDNEILIGNVGSFKKQKNQEYLIEVFTSLVKFSDKYKLIFVGDGEMKEQLKRDVDNYGLKDKILFAGVRKDVNRILSAIDIFVLPSLYEGLPLVGIEAQASGLECLFSDTITREVDLTGVKFLRLEDNSEEWVKAILDSTAKHHKENAQIIIKKGYGIEEESEKLANKYKTYLDTQ